LKDRGTYILNGELKNLASDFVYFTRKILPFFLVLCYLLPVIAVFFTAFRSDEDFWLTGNVFRVISQRDYSHFFDGIRYLNSYAYGFFFSISVSFVSFILSLKMRHYSINSGRIWPFAFILSLLPAFFYLPIASAAEFSFSLFFLISTVRYLFISVLLLEKSHLPRDIIFAIVFSASFSEFSMLYAQTGGHFYGNNVYTEFSLMPPKIYYSAALFPSAMVVSIAILWASLRKAVMFILERNGLNVDAK